ncbi:MULTISPECIES: hypothetical protein [Halobellus]|uniref:hypothetical protein n=1 Tax=Halobellus TaxID=1073986 RepID=UPI0021152C27|nr:MULTISPECIES: hypothetical protein [Halobellus]MDQ2055105.1 hypothetical protein [Halobellus sp. H-GB7]
MPISDDEWESGKQWTEVERSVAEFLDAVEPRAYTVPELHDLLADGGTVVTPETDTWSDCEDDDDDEVDVAPMDVTERQVREAVINLRDAEYLASKRIETDGGTTTYYRRSNGAFLG